MVTTRSGWWRRSRWALLSLVVLVPAAVAASLSVDAVDYLMSRPSVVTTVEAGRAADLGDARIRVLESWTAPADSAVGEEYGVPEGTALVSVTLELDASAAAEDFACRVDLLDAGSQRHWRSGFTDTSYFPGEGLPDDAPFGCSWHATPFPFEATFLIPEDAVDDVVLEVIDPRRLPRAFHLLL